MVRTKLTARKQTQTAGKVPRKTPIGQKAAKKTDQKSTNLQNHL